MLRVRAKAADGEVRWFGDDAQPIAAVVDAAEGLRVFVSPGSVQMESIKARLKPAAAERGGEVTLVAALQGRAEVEVRLPGRYRLDAALRGALKASPGVLMLEDA